VNRLWRMICFAAVCGVLLLNASGQDGRRPSREDLQRAGVLGQQGREEAKSEEAETVSIDSGLIGYWKFDGDCKDYSGNENHGRSHGVDFSAAGRTGTPGTAAVFNGTDACIEVRSNESLSLTTCDFSVAAWVRLEEDLTDVVGDIASKYDESARRGFNLCIKGSSGGYNSFTDQKNVHFGIDNAMDAPWEDCGRPWPTNTYVTPLTVFDGDLYAGIADALGDPQDACHVFRYAGGTEWTDCGHVGDSLRTPSVYSMIVHKGDLYCGTGTYDWTDVKPDKRDFVRVYRYAGREEWVDCGQPGTNYRILSLASYKGDLYCGTDAMRALPEAGKVHRYAGGTEWEDCGRLGNTYHVFALVVHNGHLYGGTQGGQVYRYEGGTEWTYCGTPLGNTQMHCFQVHKGRLYAGTWAQGYVARYEGGAQWTNCGVLGLAPGEKEGGPINEVNDLTVYNGKLYAGVIPKGEVYRYEEGMRWTLVRRLVSNPDWSPYVSDSWARVPSMAVFGGRLYAATSRCKGYAEKDPHYEAGRVYSKMAGQAISYDKDLRPGWKHIVATRDDGKLKLYVDGELASSSGSFKSECYDLTTNEPLYIGFGGVDYFSGAMDEVRMYGRALSDAEVKSLHSQRPE